MMQSFFLLAISILTTVTSQLLFKRGIVVLGSLDFSLKNVFLLVKQVFSNPFLLAGIFLYGISFIFWLFVLSKIKISIAYPITSFNFILVAFVSYLLFDEKLSSTQYGGIMLIILGIIFLARV